LCSARLRLQHDVVGNAPLRPLRLCVNPLICHSRESGNPWAELSVKWFAQRHEGIKRLLRVFVSSCEPKSYHARKYQTMGSRFRGNDNFEVLGRVDGCFRRPELVCANTPAAPGSTSSLVPSVCAARWMLKQVQHDVGGNASPRPLRLCVNPLICHSRESGEPWAELSAKWFAQRHEDTKRLFRVFVSSCEPKTYRVRKYMTMGSRFRGNDNVGILGCVNGYSPRPELVCANTPAAPGSISSLYPSVGLARWMLQQVQHDVAGNAPLRSPRLCVNPLICHSRESGNPWAELSAKWFAQRHEGIKKLLRVFVSSCEPKMYRVRKYQTMGSRFRGNDNFGVLGCVNGCFRRLPNRPPRSAAGTDRIFLRAARDQRIICRYFAGPYVGECFQLSIKRRKVGFHSDV
jgi:hypothetical protein